MASSKYKADLRLLTAWDAPREILPLAAAGDAPRDESPKVLLRNDQFVEIFLQKLVSWMFVSTLCMLVAAHLHLFSIGRAAAAQPAFVRWAAGA